jgi:hypothetical protein
LYLASGAIRVANCAFIDNAALWGGGAIFATAQGSLLVSNSVFRENSAKNGGAIFLQRDPTTQPEVSVTSSVFAFNSAEIGGAIVCDLGRARVHQSIMVLNSTFSSNGGTSGAGAINTLGCGFQIFNSIFWDNGAEQIFAQNDAPMEVTYSAIQGGFDGVGNIDQDPLFKILPQGIYALREQSPCIDAANGALAPELDILGAPRVDEPSASNTGAGPPWADMGACEYR